MTEQERIQAIRKNGGTHLKKFKRENITYAMCLEAVQKDGLALEFVPFELRSEELCEIAAGQDGKALRFIPKALKTKEMCIRAVRKTWEAYEYVPKNIFTLDFILEASVNGELIRPWKICSMKAKYLSAELYQALISKGNPDFILSVPQKYLNRELGLLAIEATGAATAADAVQKNPQIFTCLHPSLCDYEACKIYTSWRMDNPTTGYEWQCYPLKFGYKHLLQWPDIALRFLKTDGGLLKEVPKKTLTEEMCLAAMENDKHGQSFLYIPEKLRTQKVCEAAFEQNPELIAEFPEAVITAEMARRAVQSNAYNLQFIPDQIKTEEMCMEALKKEPYCLTFVPENLKTREMCMLAIHSGKSYLLKSIPIKFLDRETCLMTDCCLDNIPKELWDYDICFKAVSSNWLEFTTVPDEFIDEKMCLAALQHGAYSYTVFERIPSDKFTTDIARYASCYSDLQYLPREFLDEETCSNIFLGEIRMDEHYSGKFRDNALKALEAFPKEILTQHFFNNVFEKHYSAIEYFPEQFITIDMVLHVADVDPRWLHWGRFPEKFKNKETLDKISEQYPKAEEYIIQYRT